MFPLKHLESSLDYPKDWTWNCKDFEVDFGLDFKIRQLDRLLWPVSIHYESPIDPIFLHQIQDIDTFSLSPVWLIRDGLVPLAWFFYHHPKPPHRWSSQLLVHSSLAYVVPPSWRKFVGIYRIKIFSSLHSDLRKQKLLLLGHMDPTYCSLKSLEEQLKIIQPKSKNLAISTLLFQKFNTVPGATCLTYPMDYISKISQYLGFDFSILNWKEFVQSQEFQDTIIADLNDRMIYADNFLTHHTLGLGGSVLDTVPEDAPTDFGAGRILRLSPHHGFEILPNLSRSQWSVKTSRFNDLWVQLHKIVALHKKTAKPDKESYSRFDWPSCFLDLRSTQA